MALTLSNLISQQGGMGNLQNRLRYDPGMRSLGYSTGSHGGYGGMVGSSLPAPRAGVIPNNQLPTASNSTRMPAASMQSLMAQNQQKYDPMSTILGNRQDGRFNAPEGVAAQMPSSMAGFGGNPNLRYMNVDGASVLLPPRVNNQEQLAQFVQNRQMQGDGSGPTPDQMAARREAYNQRANALRASLQANRAASRAPGSVPGMEALANLRREQSGLDAQQRATNVAGMNAVQPPRLSPDMIQSIMSVPALAERPDVQQAVLKSMGIGNGTPGSLASNGVDQVVRDTVDQDIRNNMGIPNNADLPAPKTVEDYTDRNMQTAQSLYRQYGRGHLTFDEMVAAAKQNDAETPVVKARNTYRLLEQLFSKNPKINPDAPVINPYLMAY